MPLNTLTLEPVTITDIPALSQLWYKAFSIPANLRMFPDTPGLRTWWDEANRHDLAENPHRKYLKVVDRAAPPGSPLVAYAKWDLAPGLSGERFPAWHAESDREACGRLFGGMGVEREKFFGGREHYYLDMLVTHPDYQGQGAGSMLIQWGCDLADQRGIPVYLDAHEAAAPLYRKFGFRDREDLGVTSEGAIAMVRMPRD